LSRRLSEEVADKTAQLQHERDVIASQKEALVRLNEEKDQFFYDLSHEFRNPLTLILSPVNDLLKQEALPLPYRPRLEQVRRNARKILQLIDEVLELSKLEAGMVPVEKSAVPLSSFLQRICQDFEGAASQKGISLQLTHTIPGYLTVQTDGRKLEKIVMNLIQNALKFTSAEGSVHVKAQWTPQGMLDIWVSDTGIGIAPEHIERIFERYYQIPSGTKQTNRGGFGIGLSLCKHYATLLGGNISVFSKPGKGTDMHLTIPCKALGEMRAPAPTKVGADRNTEAVSGKSILLVDDQVEMLEYISGMLSPEYRLFTATRVDDALEVLRKQKVDLVISDYMMNGKSGLDLLTQIRQDGTLQHLPFIMVTGLNAPQFEADARRLHVSGIFSKPIEESTFAETIRSILPTGAISTGE
jgi:CheY-like chemotaxis protein/nitrogen-specific signal transduction histidine kinase